MELSFTTEIATDTLPDVDMTPSPTEQERPSLSPPEFPGRQVLESTQFGPALWLRAEATDEDASDRLPPHLQGRTLWYRYEYSTKLRQWRVEYLGTGRPDFLERSTQEVASMVESLASSEEKPAAKVDVYRSLLESLAWNQTPEAVELRRTIEGLCARCQEDVEHSMRATLDAMVAACAQGLVLSTAQKEEYRLLTEYFSREH